MLLNKFAHQRGELRWRGTVGIHTELCEFLIDICTLNGHLLHVRGIALDGNRCTTLRKDSLLRVIGEYKNQSLWSSNVQFIFKLSATYLDCIKTVYSTVRTIDIELALVQVAKSAFQMEFTLWGAACNQNQGEENYREYLSNHLLT